MEPGAGDERAGAPKARGYARFAWQSPRRGAAGDGKVWFALRPNNVPPSPGGASTMVRKQRGNLVAMLRSWMHEEDPPADLLESLSADEWPVLTEEARRQGVAPVLFSFLEQAGTLVPRSALDRLRHSYQQSAMKTGAALLQLEALLAAFSESDLGPPMLLKGAVLAPEVYSSVALRPLGDIDLLIRPADRQAARSLLQGLGYRLAPVVAPTSWHAEILAEEATEDSYLPPEGTVGLKLDVHTAPLPGIDVTSARVWDATADSRIGSATALRPRWEHFLLLLLLHIVQHRTGSGPPPRLLWWLDVALLTQKLHDQLDWDRLVAASHGVPDEIALLAAQCFGTVETAFAPAGVPEGVTRALSRGADPHGGIDMFRKVRKVDLRNARVVMARSSRLASPLAKLRWAAGYAFPQPTYVTLNHGVGTRRGLICWYAARPFTALWEVARSLGLFHR